MVQMIPYLETELRLLYGCHFERSEKSIAALRRE